MAAEVGSALRADSSALARTTLARAAAFLRGTRTRGARSRCPVHRTEHLGKSAYLLRAPEALAPEEQRALAVHLARALRPHPEQREVFVFGPGAREARNLASHAVDSASIAASLAAWLARGNDEPEVRIALQRCARSYLAPLAATKRIPAQRAWALWGLAEAAAALRDEELRLASRRGLDAVLRSVRADGGVLYDESDRPRGTGSASAFYHSRVVGFAWLAARALGDEALLPDATLQAAARWLALLLFPDGAKAARPEAKPWYFPEGLEDISAPFDLLLLVPAARRAADRELATLARARLARHARCFEAAGAVHASLERGEAFQCASFFAAHALLLAEHDEGAWRALDALAEEGSPAQAPASAGAWELRGTGDAAPAAKLARWRSPHLHALFLLERGHAGALHGAEAGGVIVACAGPDGRTRAVPSSRERPPGSRWRGTRVVRSSADFAELRFALHLLRLPSGIRGAHGGVRARWARFRGYLRAVRAMRAGWIHASDAELVETRVEGRRLALRWRARDAGGAALPGVELHREIVATALGFVCRERLHLAPGVTLQGLAFVPPNGATMLRGAEPPREARGPLRLALRYTLRP